MRLWDFFETQLFPLFGDLPTEAINLGILGEFTVRQILQFGFWVILGAVCFHFLLYLPYRWILSLMRVKKWRGK